MAANATANADQAAAATRTAQRDTASSTDFVTTGAEHMSDIGQSESWTTFNLESARRDRVWFDNLQADTRRQANDTHLQAMQVHAATQAHASDNNQQVTRHNDLAIDRQWNPDEVAQMTTVVTAILAKMAQDN